MLSYRVVFLITFIARVNSQVEESSSTCIRRLGVEYNENQLDSLKLNASVFPTDADSGRLNNPSGSWCFTYDQLQSEDISFSVDLGAERIITGFATQGPPAATIPKGYSHNIAFIIRYSVDGIDWKLREHGQTELRSFADYQEPNTVEQHFWVDCVHARHVKFTVDKLSTIVSEKGCLRFELLGCGTDLQPNTSFQLDAAGNGFVKLTWSEPSALSWKRWAPLGIENFSMSYVDVDGTEVQLNTRDERFAVVKEPYFGAPYEFKLKCILGRMQFNCGSKSTFLYPSCPVNWIASGSSCLHSDSTTGQWPTVRDKCFDDGNKRAPSSLVALNVSIWMGKQKCLDFKPTENIIDRQCCCTISAIDDHKAELTLDYCSADEIKPLVCLIEHKVKFSKILNLRVIATSENSVRLTWDHLKNGWQSPYRRVLIAKSNKKWTDERESDESQSSEELASENWRSVKSTRATTTLDQTELELNGLYSVIIVPSGSESRKDVFKTQFHLLSIGAVMSVDVNSFVDWSGIIKVEWEAAAVRNGDSTLPADGYTVQWSNEANRESANTSVIRELRFNVDLPTFEDVYEFVLFCHFKGIVVQCGRTRIDVGSVNYKYIKNGATTLVHSYNRRELNWTDAIKMCEKQGGHLTSVVDYDEYELITKMAINKESFWIGGTNCGGKALNAWADGLRWSFAVKMRNFNNDSCCLQTSYVEGDGFIWEGSRCHVHQPFVCKFLLTAVTAPVMDLRTTTLSSTRIMLQWAPPTKQWQPTYFDVYKCTAEAPSSCSKMTTVKTARAVLADNLMPKSRYKFIVDSFLSNLNMSTSVEISDITKEQNVDAVLTREGALKVKWSRKIREGSDNVACKISLNPKENSAAKLEFKGTASQLTVVGLKFNAEYDVIIETDDGKDRDTLVLNTVPQCEKAQRQNGVFCYQLLSQDLSWENAKKRCSKDGLLVDGSDNYAQLLASVISNEIGKEIWLGGEEPVDGYCKKAVPTTQDVLSDSCEKQLSTLCQTPVEIVLLAVEGLSVVGTTETTVSISWSPPKSWDVSNYQVTMEANEVRSKRSPRTKSKVVSGTSAVITELQPGTKYKTSVTPLIQSKLKSEASGTTGQTATVEASTQQMTTLVQVTTPSAEAAAAVEPVTPEPSKQNVTFPEDLETFHIIGCATLIGLVGIALFLFIICRMYVYRDVTAQLSFEISLIVVHCLFLIWSLDSTLLDCRSMAICVHFFYAACFSFLLVEALCIAKATTTYVPIGILQKNWHCFVLGWIPPLIVIGASAGLLFDNYPTHYPCWIRPKDSDLVYASAIPVGIFAALGLCFLLLSVCFRPSTNYEVDEESYTREGVIQMTRWVVLLLFALLSASWVCGMLGMEDGDQTLLLIFIITNILLGAAVLILRYFGDAEARQRLKNLCSEGKVGPEDNISEQGLFPYKSQLGRGEMMPPDTAFIDADKGQLMFNRYVYFP